MVERARVAVVTGASSGIGKAIAKAMARQGWQVIGTGRDPERLAAAEAEIAAEAAGAPVTMLRADLSLLGGAAQLAQDIAALTDRVDLLFNNAGGMTDKLVMTDEGLEANFAGNHLGPFLLTQRLLPLLRKAAQDQPAGAVRILNTASDASEMIPSINLDDMQNLERFSPGMAYCTGKLANVLFARALADRLAGEGIVAHAVHPRRGRFQLLFACAGRYAGALARAGQGERGGGSGHAGLAGDCPRRGGQQWRLLVSPRTAHAQHAGRGCSDRRSLLAGKRKADRGAWPLRTQGAPDRQSPSPVRGSPSPRELIPAP
ncbi:SDR family NAD(P)-dependent oxidoreductase [Sphingobium sp. MP9-4]|uniref:SDR family NAD(P)-dependent oxidoreductase n=2 Tax=Sphingobium TaxID=165695 RepID=UPI001F0E144F|nr:SDR family NAD(P)-dependent oxidoreductase [Sphingobium sp. MP9-4]